MGPPPRARRSRLSVAGRAGRSLSLVTVSEVAVARALHDGLGTCHLQVRVIALAERAVPIARKQSADLAEAHGLVHLRVAAAGDVEVVVALVAVERFDLEGVLGGPVRLD